MKLTALTVINFAALVNAQSGSDIPECAQTCIDDSVQKTTSCATDNLACICKNMDAIKGDAIACVLKACGQDVALNKVLPAIKELCNGVENGGSESFTAPTSPTLTSTAKPTDMALTTSASVAAGAASFNPTGGPVMLVLGALLL
ncbi:Fc.00g033060.m01.CDS01 [Cosmosporella sp. VM-42]